MLLAPIRRATFAHHRPRSLLRTAGLALLLLLPAAAQASFLPPALMDQAAWGVAWFVVIVMPVAALVVFWMVHILPEKFAEKRHHPQKDAIQVLCLLSLLFGGLLWPIAWLWAFTRPTGYRAAYGTDKHDNYFVHMVGRAEKGELDAHERQHLHDEFDTMAERGALTPELRAARARLTALAPAAADVPAAAQPSTAGGA